MLRNIGSNWVLIVVGVASTYVLTPFIIHTLGPAGYGTWNLIMALTGYMSLLALGVPMACVRYLTQDVAEGDVRRMNSTIAGCVGLYLMIGAFALVIGGVMMLTFTAIYDVPPQFQTQARVALGLMVIQVSFGFIGLLPEGIMFAHHDFVVRNLVRVGGVVLRAVLILGILAINASLVVVAVIQGICLISDFCISWYLVTRRYPGVRIGLADFEWPSIRRIFSFSVYVLLLNAGLRLNFETDALVIGAFAGVGAIAYYTVANSLVVYLMDFVVAISSVVSPMATMLMTKKQDQELREMFLRWSKVALSLSLMASLFFTVLGPKLIGWWIDPTFEGPSGRVLQILMMSSLIYLPVRGVAQPVLMGIGRPRTPALASLLAGVLNLGLSLALIRPYGLEGVAWGTAIPNMLSSAVVWIAACRALGISPASYVRYVVPRALVGALPILALLWWCRQTLNVDSLLGLATAGSAMVLLFAVTWAFFVYRDDPYVDVWGRFSRLGWRWSRV